MHPYLPPKNYDVWGTIRQNKLAFSMACVIGAITPFALKYFLAAILIAFMALGGTP